MAISQFFNAILECELTEFGRKLVMDFLGIADVNITGETSQNEAIHLLGTPAFDRDDIAYFDQIETSLDANDPFSLAAMSEGRLVHAENQALLAERLMALRARNNCLTDTTIVYQPTSRHFREAMYTSLMQVMEERDEAHARMVASDVIHVHELEQQKKEAQRIQSRLLKSVAQAQSKSSSGNKVVPDVHSILHEKEMRLSSDAELASICQQLSTEIASRSSKSLEVLRLKESRKVERENEEAERQKLEEELNRTRALLANEKAKLERSEQEMLSWKQSYEAAIQK
jgi:hypothetical protein